MTKLFSLVQKTVATAKQTKELVHLQTKSEWIHEQHAEFLLKTAQAGKLLKPSNLENVVGDAPKKEQAAAEKPKVMYDVFKPYDMGTFVTELTQEHVLLLNKFYIFENHLLVLIKDFVAQTSHIFKNDFDVVVDLMQQIQEPNADDWLVFYNRGFFSGASQPHKHLQMVSLRDEQHQHLFPLATRLEQYAQQGLKQVPDYHFKHAFVPLNDLFSKDKHTIAQTLLDTYMGLVKEMNWEDDPSKAKDFLQVICARQAEYQAKLDKGEPVETHQICMTQDAYPSFNLLFTKQYMIFIPRKAEGHHNIPCNSLGFMFSLYVKNDQERDHLVNDIGFLNFLSHVTLSK